jgi:hypothetical protein
MPPFVDDVVRCPNDLQLLRILRNANFWYPKDAPTRASSGAFYDTTRENSCFVLRQLTAEHFEKITATYPNSKFAVIIAGQAREYGYSVCDDPSDFLPGHVVVCPPRDTTKNEYRRMAGQLALRSVMYHPPARTVTSLP